MVYEYKAFSLLPLPVFPLFVFRATIANNQDLVHSKSVKYVIHFNQACNFHTYYPQKIVLHVLREYNIFEAIILKQLQYLRKLADPVQFIFN